MTHTTGSLGLELISGPGTGLGWTVSLETLLALMPKKQRHNYLKQLQGASGKQAASTNGSGSSPSVNERLSELRRLEGRDAARKKAELAESSQNLKSVHPSLRGILGIADSAPPRPKRAVRSRIPNTPGPAPPASWTKTPGWTPLLALRTGQRRFRRRDPANKDRNRPDKLERFARMTKLIAEELNCPPSLMHFALRTAAEHWHLFDEEDLPMLAELPLQLRLKLISYLGFYGPSIDIAALEALTSGSETVSCLDLAGLAGHGSLTLNRLIKLAKQPVVASPELEGLADNEVAESWDQEESLEAALSMSLPNARFAGLTQLSLSNPPSNISWRDLLAFTKHVPSVTHLSLAYWPRPTLTPNLATTTVTSQHSPDVHAGASHFYSALDDDMYEPAAIIRQLSSMLLRLQWLDLEGCAVWSKALSFKWNSSADSEEVDGAWSNNTALTSIWLGNWKNITYVNIAQGWVPSHLTLQLLPRQQMSTHCKAIVDKVGRHLTLAQLALHDEVDSTSLMAQSKARMWLELEGHAYQVEQDINNTRRRDHVKQVRFDHGWETE